MWFSPGNVDLSLSLTRADDNSKYYFAHFYLVPQEWIGVGGEVS